MMTDDRDATFYCQKTAERHEITNLFDLRRACPTCRFKLEATGRPFWMDSGGHIDVHLPHPVDGNHLHGTEIADPPPLLGARRKSRDPNGQSITRSRWLKVLKTVVKYWTKCSKFESAPQSHAAVSAHFHQSEVHNLTCPTTAILISCDEWVSKVPLIAYFISTDSARAEVAPARSVRQNLHLFIKQFSRQSNYFFIGHVFGSILQRVTFTWASKLVSSRCKLWSISESNANS